MLELLSSGLAEQIADKALQGGSALLIAAIAWFCRGAYLTLKSAHKKLEHLDECMDAVRGASDHDRASAMLHRQEAEARDRRIAELEKDQAAIEGWINGLVRQPLGSPVSGMDVSQLLAPPPVQEDPK